LVDGDIIHDLRQIPWPFEADSIDCILASHILEHVTKDKGHQFIVECHRILKPGGAISIAVPDFDILLEAIKNGHNAIDGLSIMYVGVPIIKNQDYTNDTAAHQYVYSYESLAWVLQQVGFINITRVDFDTNNELFKGIHNPAVKNVSLYMEAQKS